MFECVGVDRLSKVGDVGYVFGLLWGGSEADLDGAAEIVENLAPGGVFRGATTVALVDDDEIEEVTGDGLEDFVFFVGTGEGLVKAEVDFVGGVDLSILDLGHDGPERLEVIDEGLVCEIVSIDEEEDALGLLSLPKAPDDLEGRIGFAGPRSHNEEKAFLTLCDGFESAINCFCLVVTRCFTPGVLMVGLEDELFFLVLDVPVILVALPEFGWRREGFHREFGLNVCTWLWNFVVGGEGVAVRTEGAGDVEDSCVTKSLLHPLTDGVGIVLGLDDADGDSGLPLEHVVSPLALLLVPGRHISSYNHRPWCEGEFAPNLADLIPSSLFNGGCDEEIANVTLGEFLLFLFGHAASWVERLKHACFNWLMEPNYLGSVYIWREMSLS